MAFTGAAVRQGNADRFGAGSPGATPRAFVSLNGEPYVITRDALVHITDLANGSGVLIQNNSNYNLSTPDPTCGFAYNSRLYFLNRDGFTLQRFDDPLTGDVSLIDFFTNIGIPSAAATDGTTVWIYDANFDALHTIDPDTAATTLLGTVGFDVTTPANNIGGMFYHGGSLFLLDNGTELMFVIEDPTAATLEATAVDVSVTEFGASQRGVNGGGLHLGEAYMAGGNPDALYRFYNVRWDETIDAVEVDAGGNGSLDLSTVSSDATSFEFAPGYTAPSWLTISGNDLVITSAPDVSVDTDYSPELRAVRSGFNEEKTLTVRVAAGATITVPSAPRSLTFTISQDNIIAVWQTASDNGGEAPSRYDVRIDGGAWISSDLNTFYLFGNLSPGTDYLIEVVQVNSAGRGAIASGTATTDAVDPLTFGTGAIADQAWEVGTAESLILPEATGGAGPITYSLSTPPAGVTFTPGTRGLAGTPTGRFALETFTYTATAGAESVELTFTIVVTATAITFASTVENQIYDVDEAIAVLTLPGATGGVGTLGYSLSPPLPMGLSRSNFDVSGTPTDEFALATFTWRATDSEGVSATVQFAIRVLAELADPHPVTVLPYTAALLEKALVDTYVVRQADVLELEDEIPIRHLYDPDTCPTALLPYLACFISVDAPSVDFSETQLRQLIRDSYVLHTRKGTIQALKDVIASLGYRLNRIEEGVASTPAVPAMDWARYRLVMDTALTIESGRALQKLIVGAAPVSRELVEITYDQANSYNGVIRYDGIHAYGRISTP